MLRGTLGEGLWGKTGPCQPRQKGRGCRGQGGLSKWGNPAGTPICGSQRESMAGLELPLKRLGTQHAGHTRYTPPTRSGDPHPVPHPQGTHVGAGEQLLHDIMVKDVAAPAGSLLLRVQLLVLLDLAKAQLQWHRDTPPPSPHPTQGWAAPGTWHPGSRRPSLLGYCIWRAPDGCHVPWVPRASPPSPQQDSACPWCHVWGCCGYQIPPSPLLITTGGSV